MRSMHRSRGTTLGCPAPASEKESTGSLHSVHGVGLGEDTEGDLIAMACVTDATRSILRAVRRVMQHG